MALTMDQVPALLAPDQPEHWSRVPPNFQDSGWGRNYLKQSAKAAIRGGGVTIAYGPGGCGAAYIPPGTESGLGYSVRTGEAVLAALVQSGQTTPGAREYLSEREELVKLSSGVVPPIYGRVGGGMGAPPSEYGQPGCMGWSPETGCIRGPFVPLTALDRDGPVTTRLGRVLRNYNARAVSRRGGILPAYATRTGGIPLPNPIRYDPMGYAYALGPEPRYAAVSPGLGQQSETPEVRSLPWEIDQGPGPEQLAAQQSKVRWERASMVVGLLGGTLGILLSWRALKGKS